MELQRPTTVAEYLKDRKCAGFKPVPRYSLAGDMLEIHVEGEPAYAETVNEHLTVLRAFSDKRIVGLKVFGVASGEVSALQTAATSLWPCRGTRKPLPRRASRAMLPA